MAHPVATITAPALLIAGTADPVLAITRVTGPPKSSPAHTAR